MARNNWFILFGLIAALAFGGCEKTVKQENGFLIGTVTVDGVAVSGVTISVYSYSTSSGNPKISSELISTYGPWSISSRTAERLVIVPV